MSFMGLKDKYKECLARIRSRNMEIKEFEYITEKPLSGDKENPLLFGHDEIVLTLRQMILNCPESFTIGLYGDWGSGKSTIVTALQKELKCDNIPLILFDVWKHEEDSLRRTFLNTLVNDLDKDYGKNYFNKDFKINERNLSSETVTNEFQTILKEKLFLHLSVILLFSAFIILPFFIF